MTIEASRGRFLVAPICLLASVLVFGGLAPTFLTAGNASNVLAQLCILALLAVGQMFAIVTRGFDISVGTTAALSSAAGALAANVIGWPGLLAAPLAGYLVGTTNGLLIGALRVQPIVATLGTLIGARSLALLITHDGQAVPVNSALNVTDLAFNPWFGLPPAYWLAFALMAVAAWSLNYTVQGRRIVMLGSNPDAAGLVGINTTLTYVQAYQLCGMFAGFGGLLMTVRAGAGLPTEGAGIELQSIAAAVIGGVALTGGIARVTTVVVGAAFIQTLLTGLNLLGVSPFAAEIAVGTVIISSGLLEHAIRQFLQPYTPGG